MSVASASAHRVSRRLRGHRPGVPRRDGRLGIRPVDRARDSDRLDMPLAARGGLLPRRRVDMEAVGRVAEVIARYLGTARYLAIQTVIVFVWIGLNIALPLLRWDPYPFILLNLAFSTQAAYAAPLILLAQNRQDDRDRSALAEDRAAALRVREDTEFLAREVAALRIAQSDAATRQYLRGEMAHQLDGLRDDLEALLTRQLTAAGGPESAGSRPAGKGRRHDRQTNNY